jgi:hypothetical protein
VIAGLIGFTYLFVEALPPAAVEAGDTSSTVAGSDGTGDGTDTTVGDGTDGGATTSTLAPEIAAFVAAVDEYTKEVSSWRDDRGNDISELVDGVSASLACVGLTQEGAGS